MQDTLDATVDATVKELFGSSPELSKNKWTMERLTTIMRHSLETQELLALRFRNRQIGAKEFEGSASLEHRATLSQIKDTIGEELFYTIFGEEGDFPEAIFDPEMVKAVLEQQGRAD